MSQFSLFEQALGRGQAYEVHMNKVGSVSFDQAPKAIGTKNLNSCSAVMMVSVKGAILGHISPLPTITNDPSAGENHVREMMTEFLEVYRREKDFRLGPEIKKSGIVFGIYLGNIALPDQKELIESILLENVEDNPLPKLIPYEISAGGHGVPQRGTVFIDGRSTPPKVYVEDKDQEWFWNRFWYISGESVPHKCLLFF